MNWRNNFLGTLLGGDHLKDYAHAARLYTDDLFRLAPKSKFLYHVVFNININATGNALSGNSKTELGMIVKRCDLPKYNFNVELRNQYNYKNYVQTGIQYLPVTIVLHDDMGDVATAFFKSYYQNYIVDTNRADIEYSNANYYDNFISSKRWGRDTGPQTKFLDSISIFQMNRQRFTEYKMMNPVVNDWNNGDMDQSQGTGINEQSFTISYSGVIINTGAVSKDNPQGFATMHYDSSPSPNSPLGGGADSIFGLIGGSATALDQLGKGNILGAALAAGNVYEKLKSGRAVRGVTEEIIGITKDAIKKSSSNLGATSKPGVRFPRYERTKEKTAQLKNNQNINNSSLSSQKPKNVSAMNNDFMAIDNKIKLNSKQISLYFDLDSNAKEKFAKYVVFRTDKNLEVNDVETEWTKLTSLQQQSYKDQSKSKAIELSNKGLINYNVNVDLYNELVSNQTVS